MKRLIAVAIVVVGCAALTLSSGLLVQAEPIPKKYQKSVEKALAWLAKQQHQDGHWGANGDQYPVAMTGVAAQALLMEGSTSHTGKYASNIRRAMDWLMKRCQKGGPRDGMIGDTNNPSEQSRYMYGHGFGLLFLASAYGDENDKERRAKLKDILTRAAKYTRNAQSEHKVNEKGVDIYFGGWYYTSKQEGGNNDEGSVTVTQLQGLRACRNAGIPVPKDTIKNALEYLKRCTTQRGGIIYRYAQGGFGGPVGAERPALTAAGLACAYSCGDYKSEQVKKWWKYCQTAIPAGAGLGARFGHDEYTHYYYAQALYMLGDDGWEKLYGPTPKDQRLTWTAYRNQMCDGLVQSQNADGSWTGGGAWGTGPIFATGVYVSIFQLDRAVLPIYQR
jgi:hypothetical protein